MKKTQIAGLKKQTENQYLNMYEMDAVSRDGAHFPYYLATRRKDGDLMAQTGILRADGVVIYAVPEQEPDKLIVLRQFRYPINAYMYELPAGLLDGGETPQEAAVREMKEETGLDLFPYTGGRACHARPRIHAQGMSDECDVTVFGYVRGKLSGAENESTEDIEVIVADKEEVRRILQEELVSVRGAYLMTAFLNSSPNAPFAFLEA